MLRVKYQPGMSPAVKDEASTMKAVLGEEQSEANKRASLLLKFYQASNI